MNIEHKEEKNSGSFFVAGENEVVAEIMYAHHGPDNISIDHTEVDENLQGKNIGYELVHRVVEYAREKGWTVTPVCPFAAAVFDRQPEFEDVRA